MNLDNNYIRHNYRHVYKTDDVFVGENVFLLDETGSLIGLNASESGLSSLEGLMSFTSLRFLDLSNNNIHDAAPLRHLSSLEKVHLAWNQIDDLNFIHHLPHLKYLDIRSNNITRLPSSLGEISIPIKWHHVFQQKGIILEGNPIEAPLQEIIARGQTELRAYLSALQGEAVPLNEIKVIILGSGRAGKTSLVRRISGESCRLDEEITREVSMRTVPGIGGLKAHFWDFGGQEFMFATHSCFFTRRAVYLVVLDARREEKAEKWLNLIQMNGKDCPVFILMNMMDENPHYDLDRAELRRKWPSIEGIYPISCKTGKGLEQFLEEFWQRSAEFELPSMKFGSAWVKAKDTLLSHAVPLVTEEFCYSVCNAQGVADMEQQITLLHCLHDLGLIFRFSGHTGDASIVLNPPWLTRAMYALLGSDKVKDQSGFLFLKDIGEILSNLGGTIGYTPEERRFVLAVMIKFEVCFLIDQDRYVIPDLLPRQEPKGLPHFDEDKSEILFHFEFLPSSVFHRFVIRLKEDIQVDWLWFTGVVLQHEEPDSRAMIRWDQNASRIHVIAVGERRRDYLTVIRYQIQNAVRASGNLSFTELIRLPVTEDYYVSYKELQGTRRMGVPTYYHAASNKVFDVESLLRSVEATDDKSESRSQPVAAKTDGNVTAQYVFIAYAREDKVFVDELAERLRNARIALWYDDRIEVGTTIDLEIQEKIRHCYAMILIMSPESSESEYVKDEIACAKDNKKTLIPIQLHAVKDWFGITRIQWLVVSDDSSWFDKLQAKLAPIAGA